MSSILLPKAKYRGLEWSLTDEQALELLNAPCFYGPHPGGGIDRLDNKIGYIPGNCVPCCKMHNFMKGTLSFLEFASAIRDTAAFMEKQLLDGDC